MEEEDEDEAANANYYASIHSTSNGPIEQVVVVASHTKLALAKAASCLEPFSDGKQRETRNGEWQASERSLVKSAD